MAYTVTVRGVPVNCSSPQEVKALLAALADTDSDSEPNLREPSQQAIRFLVESLPEVQKRMVHLLNKRWPDYATDKALREEMKLPELPHGNKKLAGILAGISKVVKRDGVKPIIRHQSFRGSGGERVHRYWLEESAHAALDIENSPR